MANLSRKIARPSPTLPKRAFVRWGADDFAALQPEVDRRMREDNMALSGAVIAAQEAILPADRRRPAQSIYVTGERLTAGLAEARQRAAQAAKPITAPPPPPRPSPVVAPVPAAPRAAAPSPIALVPPYSRRALELAGALDAVLKDHASEQAQARAQQIAHERSALAQAVGAALLAGVGDIVAAALADVTGQIDAVVKTTIERLLGAPPAPPPADPDPSPAPAPPPAAPPPPERARLQVDVIGTKDGYWAADVQKSLNGLGDTKSLNRLGDTTDVRYIEFSKVGKTTLRDVVIVVGKVPAALLQNIERRSPRLVRCGPSIAHLVEAIRTLHATH